MSIKPWNDEQCDDRFKQSPASYMLREIGELRAALQERDAEVEKWVRRADKTWHEKVFTDKIAAQRKVLEQALEALKEPIGFTGCRQIDVKLKAAITAIQETLHGKD